MPNSNSTLKSPSRPQLRDGKCQISNLKSQKSKIMRRADLSNDVTKLYKAHVELLQAWDLTKEHWKDENSQHFEDQHLAPLGPIIKLLLDATNRLNEIFSRAQRDLADPGQE